MQNLNERNVQDPDAYEPTEQSVEGKIKGRGTSVRAKHCLHIVFCGTRFFAPRVVET